MFFVILISTLCVFETSSQQLPFAHLSISDGLEDTVIFAMEQDAQGFLWITTRTGINRFDGDRFWTFGEEDGLPHNLARDILKTQNGTLWVASERGVAWFDGKRFQTIKEWPDETSARSMVQAKDGTIWVATYGSGILQISNDDSPKILNQYNFDSGLPSERIRSLMFDDQSNLWLGMSSKVVVISEGKIKEIPWKTQNSEIRTIFQHADGTVWFGTRQGIAYYTGESIASLDIGIDLSKQTINSITNDNLGNVWLGTRGSGVYKIISDNQYQHMDMSDGLPDNSVNTIFQDNENNLWFGTYGGGVARLSTSKVINWKAQAGMPNPNVYAIAEDKDNCMWFGTNGNGVSHLCNEKFTHITKEHGLPHNKVLTTIVDDGGDPWFGTLDGLSQLNHGEFIKYGEHNGMSGMVSYQVIQAHDKSFWIGTNNGLNHLMDDNFIHYTKAQGLPDNRVNRILESKNGALWLATANGLAKYENGSFLSWSTEDGLPANFINDIYEDDGGGLWIASNNGLGYFIENKFQKWTTKDGLPHNNSTVILPGSHGDIWIGTNRGVAIFDGENFTVITSREGLVFDLINRGAGYRDTKGNLWFGTGEGVSRFSADYKLGASDPPPVHLLSVTNNDNHLMLKDNPEIQQSQSSMLFDFSAISFQRAPDVQYRYRLSKNNRGNWRETRLRQLQIDSLAAGAYVFEVTARIGKGQWNAKSAQFSFTITPPFWKSWWFSLLIFLFIVATFIYRNIRSKQHAAYLEEMVTTRTQQLEEVNQGLQWMANHDNLTCLANRNYVQEKLQALSKNYDGSQLGIIIIDLDYFKKINDKYGHTNGDNTLKEFANLLLNLTAENQIASRWGGEEFLIVCPNVNQEKIKTLVKNILQHCRGLSIPAESYENNIYLRCSMGFAITPKNSQKLIWEKTIHLADMALYNAKHNGRDCAIGYIWNQPINSKEDISQILLDSESLHNNSLISKIEITNI
ncbi:MAG: two-component regulator propeller domain-containing protein [Marinicellaceae bacterium]